MADTKTTEQKTSNPRKLRGTVVSNKMKDTVMVAVERFVQHPKYKKFFKSTKRYAAHDEGNTAQVGDVVEIVETRPISKTKKFTLVK
tara:strand:+ start:372 stop:632 length:261 start_codon:yes stop_codon:yes gene_type:complete